MGVNGLIKLLNDSIAKKNIRDFAGKRVAIDCSCWIHKGCIRYAREIICNGTVPDGLIQYIFNRLKVLTDNLIKKEDILVVFDGLELPIKGSTNRNRERKRHENIKIAYEYLHQHEDEKADVYFQRGISITYGMIVKIIDRLKIERYNYMVSAYEADAQIAFLIHHNIVHAVITEDSDLLAYGCDNILLKFDYNGNCDCISTSSVLNANPLFTSFTMDQFILFACVAGCDYMDKIHNVGIKTAYKLIHSLHNADVYSVIDSLVAEDYLRNSAYISLITKQLTEAYLTFKHQTVIDPLTSTMVPLSPIGAVEGYSSSYDFLGPIIGPSTSTISTEDPEFVINLATGRVNFTDVTQQLHNYCQKPVVEVDIANAQSYSCGHGSDNKSRSKLIMSASEYTSDFVSNDFITMYRRKKLLHGESSGNTANVTSHKANNATTATPFFTHMNERTLDDQYKHDADVRGAGEYHHNPQLLSLTHNIQHAQYQDIKCSIDSNGYDTCESLLPERLKMVGSKVRRGISYWDNVLK